MSTLDVISAGIVIADCVARPVERLPPSGQLALIDSIGLYLGGSAANTAATLSKLGLRCAVVGRVGQDGFGDFLEKAIQSAGCDTRFLRRAGAATSATVVHVDAEGERTFLHAVGANANLKAADVPLDSLAAEGARALHVAGYYVLPELEPELPALLDRASRLGLLTSLEHGLERQRCLGAPPRLLALHRCVLPQSARRAADDRQTGPQGGDGHAVWPRRAAGGGSQNGA